MQFWQEHATEYPIRSTTACKLYCINASSAQSERDFSSVGHTVTDMRSWLSKNTVEAIELLRWGNACWAAQQPVKTKNVNMLLYICAHNTYCICVQLFISFATFLVIDMPAGRVRSQKLHKLTGRVGSGQGLRGSDCLKSLTHSSWI